MMIQRTFTGRKGFVYTSSNSPIGRGGEGEIYSIDNDPLHVLKIFYPEKRSDETYRKLCVMTDMHLTQKLSAQLTWPEDIVFENGAFAGFVMKTLDNTVALNHVYRDEYRAICTYGKRIVIAKNLCAAVNAVHSAGQVIGDLNPNNIAVDINNGLVTLVDTNSYHITDRTTGIVYPCEVGLPEYLAKEIQMKLRGGVTLKEATPPTFTKETDLFALAVHIFALLMNGCHPFACAIDTGADIGHLERERASIVAPQPIENIYEGRFTFHNPKPGTKPPLYAPDYNTLTPEIQTMFKRAFADGNNNPVLRPGCVEWHQALTTFQKTNPRIIVTPHPVERQKAYPENVPEKDNRQETVTNVEPTREDKQENIPDIEEFNTEGGTGEKTGKKKGRWKILIIPPIAVAAAAAVIIGVLFATGVFKPDDGSQETEFAEGVSPGTGEKTTESRERATRTVTVTSETSVSTTSATTTTVSKKTDSAPGAQIVTLSGNLNQPGMVNTESLETSYEGRYRAEIKELPVGNKIKLSFCEENGDVIEEKTCSNSGEGVTAKDLSGGSKYKIKIAQVEGTGPYTLLVGIQKPERDISDLDVFSDATEYTDQRNIYKFVPDKDGTYRFELSGMDSNTVTEMWLFDDPSLHNTKGEKVVDPDTDCQNGEGLTAANLKAGHVYQLQIRQKKGFTPYEIHIIR